MQTIHRITSLVKLIIFLVLAFWVYDTVNEIKEFTKRSTAAVEAIVSTMDVKVPSVEEITASTESARETVSEGFDEGVSFLKGLVNSGEDQ